MPPLSLPQTADTPAAAPAPVAEWQNTAEKAAAAAAAASRAERDRWRTVHMLASQPGVAKAGWLHKQSVRAAPGLKNWRRRFIVLHRGGRLTWHENDDAPVKGQLDLDAGSSARSDGSARRLVVSAGSKSLLLEAASAEERDEWVAAISSLIQQLLEAGAIRQGWVVKRSVSAAAPLKNWQRRWLTLRSTDGAATLSWADGASGDIAGSLPLSADVSCCQADASTLDASDVRGARRRSAAPPSAAADLAFLSVKSGITGDELLLRPEDGSATEWLTAINKACRSVPSQLVKGHSDTTMRIAALRAAPAGADDIGAGLPEAVNLAGASPVVTSPLGATGVASGKFPAPPPRAAAPSAVAANGASAEFARGDRCWYNDQKDGVLKVVTVVKVHYDDPPTPYYTIDVDGQERHTVHDRLTPEAATPSPPARSRPPTATEAPPPPRCLRCFVCVKS